VILRLLSALGSSSEVVRDSTRSPAA